MAQFLSLKGECVTQTVIEKSRFIATSAHVEGEEQAKEFINRIREKYKDATHNCYAYIADEKGNFLRFSDDGEPQGTAGMPMLEVVKNNNLKQVAVVVTRYFGGIKLGAGGLVRAYSGAVANNLAVAKRVEYQPCQELKCTVDYSLADALLRFISLNDCTLTDTQYADKVEATVAIKAVVEGEFTQALVNRLNGKIAVEKLREYLFPFDL